MKARNNKTRTRVKINTGLFVVAAILFMVITFCGTQKLSMYQKNLVGVTDSPALCFDEEAYKKDSQIIQDAYPCKTEVDENGNNIPADSQNDQTIFLYDRVGFTGSILSGELQVVIMTIGSFFTIASLIGGIIYWNHNRNN